MATRLSDRDDRLANETGPEQRRLPEIPRRAHLVQVNADEVRAEHRDDLLDLKRRERKRLRIADGGRERRIHAVDVDRKVHLVAIDGLHRAIDRCVDASLVDIEDADVGQTEALEILPLLAAVGPHSDVDDVLDPDVVRDPPRRTGMGPLVREVRVAEVEVGIDPDDADVFRERPHDGRREAVLPADDDWDLPGADDIGRHLCHAVHHLRRRPEGRQVAQIGYANVSYVARSISCATFAWVDRTWAFRLSMIGTRTLCVTGWTIDRFWPSNRPTPSSLAFASPCFPGFDVWIEIIRHGSSSMTMYRFTFSSRISACSHDIGFAQRCGRSLKTFPQRRVRFRSRRFLGVVSRVARVAWSALRRRISSIVSSRSFRRSGPIVRFVYASARAARDIFAANARAIAPRCHGGEPWSLGCWKTTPRFGGLEPVRRWRNKARSAPRSWTVPAGAGARSSTPPARETSRAARIGPVTAETFGASSRADRSTYASIAFR